ncbi:MAG: DUF6174 domain-containing protein [Acidimicrobiia bacterium]
MRRVLPVVIALTLVAAACAQAPSETVTASTTAPPGLSAAISETIERACDRIVEALDEGNTATLISSLEDIDGALSSSPDMVNLREYALAAGEAFPVFEDTPPSAEQLSNAAGPLIELSNGLIAAGLNECAGIGEIAADFAGPVVIDPEKAAEALEANRTKWEAEGPTTYWMEMSLNADGAGRESVCGWNGLIVVQIVDDRATSAVDRFSGCTIDTESFESVPVGVDHLFELIANVGDARTVEVDYDPTLGYPRSIFVDGDGWFFDVSVVSLTSGEADTSRADAILTELETQRGIWSSAGISSYTMTVQLDCFCPEEFRGPFVVTVVDGEVDVITWKDGSASEYVPESLMTVEGLFVEIEDNAHADAIAVTYAPLGYPSAIQIDPSFTTMDEELGVRVLDFTVSG